MASTRRAYCDFGERASGKTGYAKRVPSLRHLRQVVSRAMVRIHLIPPDLADCHVSAMADDELLRRSRLYAELAQQKASERDQ